MKYYKTPDTTNLSISPYVKNDKLKRDVLYLCQLYLKEKYGRKWKTKTISNNYTEATININKQGRTIILQIPSNTSSLESYIYQNFKRFYPNTQITIKSV